MALTNIELYEALKKDLSEESARLIAEIFPKAEELGTKSDFARLEASTKSDISRLEAVIAHVDARIAALGQELGDRMLKYFVPLWIAVFGALASMIGLMVVLMLGR